jgi:hypothetical protein
MSDNPTKITKIKTLADLRLERAAQPILPPSPRLAWLMEPSLSMSNRQFENAIAVLNTADCWIASDILSRVWDVTRSLDPNADEDAGQTKSDLTKEVDRLKAKIDELRDVIQDAESILSNASN